jgi:hypothetical protein
MQRRMLRMPWQNGAHLRVVVGLTSQNLRIVGSYSDCQKYSGACRQVWLSLPWQNDQRFVVLLWRHRSEQRHVELWLRGLR